MTQSVVLLFGLAEEPAQVLTDALRAAGVRAHRVPDSHLGLRISEILARKAPAAPYDGEALAESMAVLHNLGNKGLDAALAAMRASGVSLGLKAITTPVNLYWTPIALQRSLLSERAAIEQARRKQ